MPDLSPLPPLREVPAFAPDPDRFARTAHVARRRRAVRTVPVGAAAVALVVAVLGTGGGTAPSGLDVVAPGPTTYSAPATFVPAPGAADPTTAPRVSPSTTTTVAPGAPDGTPPRLTSPPAPSRSSAPPPEVVLATLSFVPYDSSLPCRADSADRLHGWCMRSRTPATVRGGGWVDVVLEVCRVADAPGALEFRDTVEVEYRVFPYSSTDSFAGLAMTSYDDTGEHRIDVPATTCARWTSAWRATNYHGRPIARGTYPVGWGDFGRLGYHTGVIVSPPGDPDELTVT